MSYYSDIDLDIPLGIGHKILYFQSIDSTNKYLRTYIDSFPEGTVIWADTQTQGRGRGENKWDSPSHKGLYFSVLLKPRLSQDDIQLMSLMISLAVQHGVEEAAADNLKQPEILDIKWPNDLLHNGKKWCGILVEGVTQQDTVNLVAGIGLNIENVDENFDKAITTGITSLNDIYGGKLDHREVLRKILLKIEQYYRNFNPAAIVEEYKSSCSIWGRRCIISNDEEWKGLCKGITDKGELIMEVDGAEKVFINGTLRVEW